MDRDFSAQALHVFLKTWSLELRIASARCWLCGEESDLAEHATWPECDDSRACIARADEQAVFLRRVGFARPEQGIDLGEGPRSTRAGYV